MHAMFAHDALVNVELVRPHIRTSTASAPCKVEREFARNRKSAGRYLARVPIREDA